MGGAHVSKTSRGAFAPGGRALAARRGLIAAAALVASIVAHAVARARSDGPVSIARPHRTRGTGRADRLEGGYRAAGMPSPPHIVRL